MRSPTMIAAAAIAAALTAACGGQEPTREPATDAAARPDTAATEAQRKRDEDRTKMENRVADLEGRWTELSATLAANSRSATAAIKEEVIEDVKNVRGAVADLRTTTAENWWERHERIMERNAEDIEEDVRRFTKGRRTPAPASTPDPPSGAAPFESRRDRLVTRLQNRVDAMEEHLKNARATGAQRAELEDTRARVGKLKGDVERLRKASPDDWWDLSATRVNEYIDRVENSIRRLDDNKTGA